MVKKLNKNLQKMVNMLSDGEYHDGNKIGLALQMTRSAVWKMIKKLEQYEVKIQSVRGKGYALLEPLILLDDIKIKKKLAKEKINCKIFESIESTSDYLKKCKNNESGTICLAEQQTQGKGRLNRDWHSPFGANIYLSCFYSFQKDLSEIAGLSLVTALAIIKTLQTYDIDEKLMVKWPNDILYAGKKLSGTLIEIDAESHGTSNVVIGIGLNVNMFEVKTEQISQEWTSLRKILNKYIDRNELCARLIHHLMAYLREFNLKGFDKFREEWIKTDCLAHQIVTLKTGQQKISGQVMGINKQGHLLLKLDNGSIQAFSSGDASILKQ